MKLCESCHGELRRSATISNVFYCDTCRLEYVIQKDAEGVTYAHIRKAKRTQRISWLRQVEAEQIPQEHAPCRIIRRYDRVERESIVPDSDTLLLVKRLREEMRK